MPSLHAAALPIRTDETLMKSLAILTLAVVLCAGAAAKCIPYTEADNRVGDQACVTGTVVKVAQGKSGTFFLNFCEKYRDCPFTVVVFPSNLKDVGDVRELEGKLSKSSGKSRSGAATPRSC